MILKRSEQVQLYLQTAAAVHAKFARNGEAKAAAGTAHLAHSHALASVAEAQLRARVAAKRK